MARSSTSLRGQILESALRLFFLHGFRGTSLQDIASDAGCSKASLLYHFSNKEAILLELLAPAGQEMSELDACLTGLDDERAAVAAVTGFVDLMLRFRREVRVLFDNLSVLDEHPSLASQGAVDRLTDALAGRSAEPQDRVAAFMVLGAVFMTGVHGFPDLPDDVLREAMIGNALRTLGRIPR